MQGLHEWLGLRSLNGLALRETSLIQCIMNGFQCIRKRWSGGVTLSCVIDIKFDVVALDKIGMHRRGVMYFLLLNTVRWSKY